jgi:hypothetical protein
MAEATLILTPVDGRIGKSRQVPAITVKPEEREATLTKNVEKAFHKYHRRGIEAVQVGTATSAAGSWIVIALYCAATDNRIGEVHARAV